MERNLKKEITKNEEIPFEELVEAVEGEVKFLTFPPSKYTGNQRGTALTKSMPVFYNPVMMFNRDLTLIVYRAFQKLYSNEPKFQTLSICDSMAASGIRAMRLLKFLKEPISLLAND
jgi:tRNA G26 N,N-dimethylase Trm1